jgi:hypothetical protein
MGRLGRARIWQRRADARAARPYQRRLGTGNGGRTPRRCVPTNGGRTPRSRGRRDSYQGRLEKRKSGIFFQEV